MGSQLLYSRYSYLLETVAGAYLIYNSETNGFLEITMYIYAIVR